MSKKSYDQGVKDGVQGNSSKEGNEGPIGTGIKAGADYLETILGGNPIGDAKDYKAGYKEGERIRKS
ncbi:Uncharacterized protein dnl_51550 [Desulfonema limicola]|uniref:Uncharacterized protein n=1 Tax=Desulfonema limicola TaxID=45656 RepID=A0A975BCE2_9BACT|nr:hypothetical protein [Desulfonema limicola]QTA82772.1 Uncharacterized protein dnl_51550 [Desulfonema limicola]